ncbi:hypothetical protein C8R46DRAFT_862034, partial [Mycena filopes]
GHLNVRHVEPMMNTVNPILTYLNRCNSDVTSLLSGTAVKAVVSYVSDYISKLSLKSYQMFASVYDVFQKNSELMGGTLNEKESARHMMRKMVNAMSAKMEIGSPMASMYLLGNPDHYASHQYVPFAWRPYVQFIRNFWTSDYVDDDDMEGGLDDDERVQIGRLNGKFVPSSGVDDYRYRPPVYSHLSLFEWIQSSEKKKRTEKERARFEEEVRLSHHYKSDYKKAAAKRFREDGGDSLDGEDPLEDELEFPDDKSDFCSSGLNHEDRDDVSDWETDDDDDVIIAKQDAIDKSKRVTWHAFATEHGQFPTHAVTCHLSRLADYIPNFIGGSIPTSAKNALAMSDKGDRAAYCMTMLTLFQPWR